MPHILKTFLGTASLVLVASGAFAQCAAPGGVVVGATGGAVAGAVVGGPIGLVAGAIIGGTVGGMPTSACNYVIQHDVPEARYQGEIVVGQPLPNVAYYPIPQHDDYQFAYVNGHRVLVDPRTHVVVQVLN